jgi:hypothetical protein
MADSENSRILPLRTRRSILSAGAVSLMAAATKQAHGAPYIFPDNDDALLALWRHWNSVHHRRRELTFLQQQLETKLLEIAEEPMVALHVPGKQTPVFAFSVEEIERTLSGTGMVEARNQAMEKLRSLQQEWDRTGWELGYTQACEEEVKADRLEWELAETLWSRSANSLDGVVAKLHSMIEMAGPGAFINENPVPVLRSILTDLMRINI